MLLLAVQDERLASELMDCARINLVLPAFTEGLSRKSENRLVSCRTSGSSVECAQGNYLPVWKICLFRLDLKLLLAAAVKVIYLS